MKYQATKLEIYRWMYQYFSEQPEIDGCIVPKGELLTMLMYDIESQRKATERPRKNLNSLREEILRVLKDTTPENPMSAGEVWEKSPILQQERQVMGVTNLLKKMVEDGVVIKIPRPYSDVVYRYHVRYYINPEYQVD